MQTISGPLIRYFMKRQGVTIRDLAARMQITQKRVRQVRAEGVRDDLFVRDWLDALGLWRP